jgi:hypothetical protein
MWDVHLEVGTDADAEKMKARLQKLHDPRTSDQHPG